MYYYYYFFYCLQFRNFVKLITYLPQKKSTILSKMGNNFSKHSFDKKEEEFEELWQDALKKPFANGNAS